MSERGQTEVLGYALIFSVVVLTVALVTVAGQAGLAETRDTQQADNIEEGFAVLAENVDDLVRGGVPSRATELDLSGESVSIGPPVTVTVRATSGGTTVFDRSRSVRPVVYRADSGARLVYVNGAVVARGKDGGVTMLREPRVVVSGERAIVPVVNTSFDRRQLRGAADSVDRQSRLLVRTERRRQRVLGTTDEPVDLTVEVTSPRADAWLPYLESLGATGCTQSGSTVACTYATDAATVVETRVAVSLE